jgi:ATP-dependent exoDNAse (exonuclease V) beta subunit
MALERVILPDAHDLEHVVEDVCLEGDIAHEISNVLAMSHACLQSTHVKRALAGGQWWREVPFLLSRDPSDPDSGALVSGRVDMVYRQGEELVVIDYKTDSDVTVENAEDHAQAHHSGQAEVYAQALAAATGLAVREVVFVYCKAGVEVRLRDGKVVR